MMSERRSHPTLGRTLIGICLLFGGLAVAPYGGASAAGKMSSWRLFVNTHPAPLFYQAAGIAVGGNGNVFVADIGNHRVEKFTPARSLIKSWGVDGPGPL